MTCFLARHWEYPTVPCILGDCGTGAPLEDAGVSGDPHLRDPQPTLRLMCGISQVGHCPEAPTQTELRAEIHTHSVRHTCPLGQGYICPEWGIFKTHTKVLYDWQPCSQTPWINLDLYLDCFKHWPPNPMTPCTPKFHSLPTSKIHDNCQLLT